MKSVWDEIAILREQKPFKLDYQNSNRYRIITNENDSSKTAYYFGVPIYNKNSRKLMDMKFNREGKLTGTSANILSIGNEIFFENDKCKVKTILPGNLLYISEQHIKFDIADLYPTLNGIAYKANCVNQNEFIFNLQIDKPCTNIRANNKSFSIMESQFKPFITVSCIGTFDDKNKLIAPCKVKYQKLSDNEFALSFSHSSPYGRCIMFEINMYEQKLFQDTTVESLNPKDNNAFGGMAYIGNTATYGEQWLYSKLDYSVLSEMYSFYINKAVLHLPKQNYSDIMLSSYGVSRRFCSFGSNWNNKISDSGVFGFSKQNPKYCSIDITNLIVDGNNKNLKNTEGFILKNKSKDRGFVALSTSDSFFAPQILEINFN